MLPTFELIKSNNLDTLGCQAIDHLYEAFNIEKLTASQIEAGALQEQARWQAFCNKLVLKHGLQFLQELIQDWASLEKKQQCTPSSERATSQSCSQSRID